MNNTFIARRIERIRGYYSDLNELLDGQDSFPRKIFFYYAIERVIQLIVDEVIDVNNYIIDQMHFSVPDDFQTSFRILADNKVVSPELADRLAPIVGLRNRLVHRYETIDRDMMLQMIQKEKEDIREYAHVVESYFSKKR